MNWKDGQLLLFLIALIVNIMEVPPSLYPYTSPTLSCTIYLEAQLGAVPISLTEHGVSSVHNIFYPSSRPSSSSFSIQISPAMGNCLWSTQSFLPSPEQTKSFLSCWAFQHVHTGQCCSYLIYCLPFLLGSLLGSHIALWSPRCHGLTVRMVQILLNF